MMVSVESAAPAFTEATDPQRLLEASAGRDVLAHRPCTSCQARRVAQELGSDDARAGLYDGFEAYRTPTHEERGRALSNGLVVVDANVLLNLYRYLNQPREDLFLVLERLGDRLWVPHQALLEFWRNRESAMRDPGETVRTLQKLECTLGTAITALGTWARRVSLPDERADEFRAALAGGFETAVEGIKAFREEAVAQTSVDTAADLVLVRLEALLAGRVGPPPSEEGRAAAVAEARKRIREERPPGYMDQSKDGDRAVGDYLVWSQLLDEAERRSGDVAFVCGDLKEDWWRKEDNELRGPRPELCEELRERAGGRLLMLQPSEFMAAAKAALGVQVHDASVAAAEAVDRLAAERGDVEDEARQEAVGRYWRDYLNRDTRRFFRAAAGLEQRVNRRFDLAELAAHMSVDVESVRSYKRDAKRSAAAWLIDTGARAPLRLIGSPMLTADGESRIVYRLPGGIAEDLIDLPLV